MHQSNLKGFLMPDENEYVIRYLFESWGNGAILPSVEKYLSDDARWLNSGLPECVGKSACLALAEKFAGPFPVIKVEIRSLAASGDAVLAERLDRLVPSDGSVPVDVEVTGSFRLRHGKIYYWYDYFDPSPFVSAFGG